MRNKIKQILGDKEYNEIISKAGVFLVFRALAFLFGYAFALVTIKYYGVDTYGFVTLSFTILMIISVLCRLGFDVNLTKVFSIENSSKNTSHYFYSILISFILTSLIGGAIFLYSKEISIYVFSKPQFDIHLKLIAVTIPLWSVIIINTGVFRGLKKVLYYSALDNFGRFSFSILILFGFILLDHKDSYYPLVSHFVGLLILVIISLYSVWRSLKSKKILNINSSKKFLTSSFPIMISSSIIILLAWSDKILLGIYDTEKDIAIYDIAIRIATLITFNLDAINSILSSKISKFYNQGQMEELKRVVQFSSKVNSIIAFIIFMAILLFSTTILRFFGEDFVIGKTTLLILISGQLFNSICGPVGNLLHMTGNQKEFRNIMGFTLILNIILNVFLIKKMGINGAALATTISLICWNILGVIAIKKKLNLNSFYNPF